MKWIKSLGGSIFSRQISTPCGRAYRLLMPPLPPPPTYKKFLDSGAIGRSCRMPLPPKRGGADIRLIRTANALLCSPRSKPGCPYDKWPLVHNVRRQSSELGKGVSLTSESALRSLSAQTGQLSHLSDQD